jgi:hypothetical protein
LDRRPQQPLQVDLSPFSKGNKVVGRPRGSRLLKTKETSPFMNPPNGFVGEWNSLSEWFVYLGLWYILNEEGDPMSPPFDGGYRFSYQVPAFGGRSNLGGQVIDFIVTLRDGQQIGLYVQSDRYHLLGGPERESQDLGAQLRATAIMRVAPIVEFDIIRDPTGEACCRTLVNALGGRQFIGPTNTGTYITSRAGKMNVR